MTTAVQRNNGTASAGSGTSHGLAFGSNVTAGNTIIVGIHTGNNATVTISSVTDNLGNTYNLAAGPIRGNPSNSGHWQYYANNIAGGACTVTVVLSAGADRVMHIHEVSGLDPAGSLDDTASVASGSGVPSVGTVDSTVADGFVLAQVSSGASMAQGTGWTLYNVGDVFWYDTAEYRTHAAVTSYTGAFDGSSTDYTGLIVAYKAAAGGGGDPEAGLVKGKLLRGGLLLHGGALVR